VKATAKKDSGVLDTQVKGQRVSVTYDSTKTDPEKIAEAIPSGGDTVLPDA
jgi:copper chaperone CopZ